MTLNEFQACFRNELTDTYPPNELESILTMVIEHFLGLGRAQRILEPEKLIEQPIVDSLTNTIERLRHSEPIQYILEKSSFYDLDLEVSPAVLIPRPETEELVRWILESAKSNAPSILDIGTGSGCISLALKKNIHEALVMGLDISKDALEIASRNAAKLGLDVEFKLVDILSKSEPFKEKFDIIVSNPPYVTQNESNLMNRNVLNYEPQGALFVPDEDPLLFYRRIAELGRLHLNKSGLLFFEINERYGKEVSDQLLESGYSGVELKKDLNGKDRMVKAKIN